MGWVCTDDVDSFWDAAGELLRGHPVENTLMLTIADTLRRRGAAAFTGETPLVGWSADAGGPATAAFVHTPPYPVILTDMGPPAASELAGVLGGRGHAVTAVSALPPVATAFAAGWCERTGSAYRTRTGMRLYRLGTLVGPQPAPAGSARVATGADRDLLGAWIDAFTTEVHGPSGAAAGMVDERLDYGGLTLWEVDGVPVAMAGVSRGVAGMVRVAPVYTPPEYRGRGYGGAVTTAVSQAALDTGAQHVVLFTDPANPTSNELYQRLGYRPVQQRSVLELTAAPASKVS
jgi:GNAT superfamily N-acetyltransferase